MNHFLALTGAQEVTLFVRPSDESLSRALNIHLRAVWASLGSFSGLKALLPYFVIQSEPKILCLVFKFSLQASVSLQRQVGKMHSRF